MHSNSLSLGKPEKSRGDEFRNDINGLRAWAVIAVICYHFNIRYFDGGFIGVDVFFVISGFLMSKIIIEGLDRGKFSLIRFYGARVRRIVPPLLAVSATMMIAGWYLLPAADYRILSNHVISSITFVSNIRYWHEAGYFDAASHDKWLLHTWSLSVECQFYMLFPLILMAIWGLFPRRKAITMFLLIGALASFFLSIIVTPNDQTYSFYMLPTRAWELFFGGLVYVSTPALLHIGNRSKIALEYTGFLIIIVSIGYYSSVSLWPSWRAGLPVLGASLVIAAARNNSFLTSSRIAQSIGSVSYSLYLWHWPFVVLLAYFDLERDKSAIVAALVLCLVAGYLSSLHIEKRFRLHLNRISRGASFSLVSALIIVVLASAVLVRHYYGVKHRFSHDIEMVFNEANDKNPRMSECHVEGKDPPGCTYGGPKLGAIVIGDSHAESIMTSVRKSLPDSQLHVLDWSLSSCPTVAGVKRIAGKLSQNCGQFVTASLQKQGDYPHNIPIIIMNRTSSYALGANDEDREEVIFPTIYFNKPYSSPTKQFLAEYKQAIVNTACTFAKTRPTYLIRPIPELRYNVPNSMGRAMLVGFHRRISISLREYYQRNKFAYEAQDEAHARCGVGILDPIPLLCDAERCYGDKDGIPLYYDSNHLSEFGATQLIPLFSTVFTSTKTVHSRIVSVK